MISDIHYHYHQIMTMNVNYRWKKGVINMFPQQQNCIDSAINERCAELKTICLPYIKSTLDEMLNQAKKFQRILLYDLMERGDLELPEEECEAFVRKFILDNEKMVLDTLLIHKTEEFLDRQLAKLHNSQTY